MRIVANEFVIPFVEGRQCHASQFITLGEGKIFCVFFYGSCEGNDDVRIWGAMRTPDCRWSEPVPLTEDDGLPHWNPVLHRRTDGTVLLFYKVGKPIANWYTRCQISYDNCVTWEPSFDLVPGDIGGGRGPVRNKVIDLPDGTLLAPASTEQGEWKCFFDLSRDGGATWQRSEDIRVPVERLAGYDSLTRKGVIQPTVWASPDGLHALMRSSEGCIYRTDSTDGIHWCDAYSIDFPNNNSGIDVVCLPDGRVILCCNPVSEDWGSRSPISLFVSDDNGYTFRLLTHLTTMQGEFSYPALRYEDRLLHITYTWQRKTVQYFCLADL